MTSTTEFIANVQAEVDNFQNKIKELDNRKTDIDSEIAGIRTEIKRRNDLLMVWEGKADVQPKGGKRMVQRRSRSGGGMKVILEILESAGRPLDAREVLDGLISRDVAGSAKNPILAVRSAIQNLKKQGRVVSAGLGLFRLPS